MSIRTINGISGGSSTNVYVNNMFASGEATEVIQTSNTTQAKVNVSFKSNTDSTTTLNDDDWLLVADNATGKIVKRITVSNVKNEATHWTLNSTKLYPDATTYNVLLGTTSNTNSRKLMVSGTGEFTGVLTLGSTINDLTLPTGTKTLATLTGIETFTNKTLTTPTIDQINNSSSRVLISQSGATTITIGNTTDITAIFGCETILNSNERGLFSYISASSTGTLGNSNDDLLIERATLQSSCVWNGGVIAYNYGGTGQSSWTKGDILYADNNNSLAKLSIGTTGQVLKVSSGLPSWGTDNDTNYFSKVSSNIYPINTTDNFLVGTSSNGVSAKLYVDGDTYLVGDEIVITGEKNSTGSTSTAFTLNGKSYVASSTSMTAYTEMIKLVNPQKSGGADQDPTLSLKAGHLELRGTETDGTTRLDCFGINAKMFNATSGAVEDYDDILNVINCIAGGSTNYPQLQMKLNNTNGSNGQVLTVNASGHCSWATPASSQWTLSSSSLYPLSTATNVLVGTTSNSSSRKIMCNGAFEATGIVVGSFAGANSFSFINGAFYNDANKTLYLDHNANQYGYGQRGIDSGGSTYSDIFTYTQSSGTAISSIGSYSNCRFSLFSNNVDFLCSVPTSRGWISMGQQIAVSDSHTPLAQLHIENALSSLNAGDTRIIIKSQSSNQDCSLLFSVNDATDGTGSYVETEVYGDSNGDLNLRGAETKIRDNSATEKFRFSSTTNVAVDTVFLSTKDLPSTQSNTALVGLAISGGGGSAVTTRWKGASGNDGTRYYYINFIPPYHTGGPWSFWVEDGGASNFGLSYGSSFLWYADSSLNLIGNQAWSPSDERIKEDIVNADTQECINIIKRLPLKQYRYKEVLRDKCSGFTQSKVFGWVAQDIKADSVMNYASTTSDTAKYYDKETNSILEYEVENLEVINKPRMNCVVWGAVSGLIDIIEQQQQQINQQQAIIDKLTNASSFKAFKDSL
jgi:hypothetical protein